LKASAQLKERLIVALDTPSLEAVRAIMTRLKGLVSFYKVGLELFSAQGWQAVEIVKSQGCRVFVDLKLHDIPNTVARAVAVLCEHEVDMLTVHTLGGTAMMKKAREVVEERIGTGKHRPLVMGVTVLTSHSEQELASELGIAKALPQAVMDLAALAHKSGLDGVISSPQETAGLRAKFGRNFIIVTPGIRPGGTAKADQKRVLTPKQAVEAGADYLVIGRPITAAADPGQVVENILKSTE
jgi:orotidine-5'-phosphate decarboxylase